MNMMVKIQGRRYYSPQHVKSAALFTRQSYQIEEEYRSNGVLTDELIEDHRSFVTGAIFSTVSFLEATINELFADTAEYSESQIIIQLDPLTRNLMAGLWKLNIPLEGKDSIFDKYSTLDKFQLALHLARKEPLKKGQPPYQDVSTLIAIRNILIHCQRPPVRDRRLVVTSGLHRNESHTFAGVPLWLHGPRHQGWLTNIPSWPSPAGPGAS